MDEQAGPGVFFSNNNNNNALLLPPPAGGAGPGLEPVEAAAAAAAAAGGASSGVPVPASAARAQYSVPGILHFLQHEWGRFEAERAEWEAERAELQVTSRSLTPVGQSARRVDRCFFPLSVSRVPFPASGPGVVEQLRVAFE